MDAKFTSFIESLLNGNNDSHNIFAEIQLDNCSISVLGMGLRQLKNFIVQNNITKIDVNNNKIFTVMLSIENEIRNNRSIDEQFSSVGILEERKTESINVLLIPEDFPKLFRGLDDKMRKYAHPDDYKITETPMAPYVFVYKDGIRTRLFMRLSFKLNNGYVSATFIFDTGCSVHFLISPILKSFLRERIKRNDTGENYLKTVVDDMNALCIVKDDVPEGHQPANFMGLPMFFLLGVHFQKQRIATFDFDEDDTAHNVLSFANFPYI